MATVDSSALIGKIKAFVQEYMSQYDASHDFTHIQRVVSLAHRILTAERLSHPEVTYDATIVTLGALMHDMGDLKYTELVDVTDQQDPTAIVVSTLLSLGAPRELGVYVQTIVKNVSYGKEVKNLTHVQNVLRTHPELAIVQDTDRIDALGAIGIGRIFTYGGAKGRPGGPGIPSGLEENIHWYDQRMYPLEGMMKTEEGRRMAVARIERCKAFKAWWQEEMQEVA